MRWLVALTILISVADPAKSRAQSVLNNAIRWQQLELQRQQIELQRLEIERQRLQLQQLHRPLPQIKGEELRRQLEFERQQAELYRKRQLERAKAKKPLLSN